MDQYTPLIIARFWSKVEVGNDGECWPWRGGLSDGYGMFGIKKKTFRANRISWELFNGKKLGKLFACHHCNNKDCCNPMHIYAGTHKDNMRDVRFSKTDNSANFENIKW